MVTIFKGLQLDIGAPPQFMDFRYTVHDPLARRVPPRPLRRPDGRRADGAVVRDLDVPRHRGPHLRRHRGRHQPEGPGASDPPAAAVLGRPAPALRVDGDHRRVPPRGERDRRVPGAPVHPRRALGAGPDHRGRRRCRLLRPTAQRPRLRRVLPLGPGPHRRRGGAADAPARPRIRAGPAPARRGGPGAGDRDQAAHRDRRDQRGADPPRACSSCRHRGRAPGARAAPAAQPGRLRRLRTSKPGPSA